MLVFSREVFVCICSTDVPRRDPAATGLASRVRFVKGSEADLARVDPEHHNEQHVAELRSRLARGEHWVIVEADEGMVGYTWLHGRDSASYPSLPGCEVTLSAETAYAYDAWTPPQFRGQGLRRVGFLEELNILKEWGKRWEASFFVKHQLEGATRSLNSVGIEVVPIWRVFLQRDRTLGAEQLAESDAVRPSWLD